jgi:hypothetical protein
MQRRQLSHGSTFLFKFVWPCAWLGSIGGFLVSSLLGFTPRWGPGITPFWGHVILVVLFVLGIAMLVRLSLPLKRVEESVGFLHISNYLSNEVVPVTNIRSVRVTGDFGRNRMPSVEVWFRQRTRYGSKIVILAASEAVLTAFLATLESSVEINLP